MRHVFFAAIILIFFLSACREEYNPPVVSSPQSLLVVEANLTVGGPTSIRLTKTFKLDDSARLQTVNGATLTVEGKDNSIQSLSSAGNGYYMSPGLNLSPGNEYRLRIHTTDGKEFLSDYVVAKATPDIDSISWEKNNDGVTIYTNTHDPSNSSTYYRWEYTETWEHRSPFVSDIIYDNGAVRSRVFPQEDISACWTTLSSTNIFLANSVRLQSDVISKVPLKFIPLGDLRISIRYSINVRQFALSKEAYTFYELMKQNTEDIGSFFGPLPSELRGNIQCITNPAEPVIGFVTASSVPEKRIFITINQVRPWFFQYGCEGYEIPYTIDSVRAAVDNGYLLVYDLIFPPKYLISKKDCVDCRERGGTTTKPSFW